MVLAVASMTAFYSCGPSAEDQATTEDEVATAMDEAINEATTEEATTEEVVAEEETTEEVVAEDGTTEETPAEEATEETEEAPAE